MSFLDLWLLITPFGFIMFFLDLWIEEGHDETKGGNQKP
jgi:hypothetical protein